MTFDPDAFLAEGTATATAEFDPDAFLAEGNKKAQISTDAFDPNAFLNEGQAKPEALESTFNPDAFLSETPDLVPDLPPQILPETRQEILARKQSELGRELTQTEYTSLNAEIAQKEAAAKGNTADAMKLSKRRAEADVAARNQNTAEGDVAAVRAPYLAVRGVAGGVTLGASDIALRQIEKSAIGEPVQAETMTESMGENVGRLLGSIFTGANIASGMAKSGTGTLVNASKLSGGLTAIIANTGARPFAQLVATRAATSLATMAPQQAASVINGDVPIADAIRDTAINALGAIVGVGPEIFVKPGVANFLAQVTGQVAFDAATDATLTGRLTKENFQLFQTQEESIALNF